MKKSISKAREAASHALSSAKSTLNAKGALKSSSPFDMKTVAELTEFMKEHGLVEMQLRSDAKEIHLRRAEAAAPISQSRTNGSAGHAMPAPVYTNGNGMNGTDAHKESEKNLHTVKSPFVGTFYRSPGPGKPAFADVGKVIDVGDTLCIIEAMKLMNEIESDCRGRVAKVCVQDGTPVEFGEPLFEIEIAR